MNFTPPTELINLIGNPFVKNAELLRVKTAATALGKFLAKASAEQMRRYSQQVAGKVNSPELKKAIIARGEQMANIRRTGDVNTEYIPALNLKRMHRDVMNSKTEPESLLQLIRRHPEYRSATELIQKHQNDIARINHISGKLKKIPDREYEVLNDDINKAWNSDDKGFWHRLLMRLRGQIPTEKYQAKDNARKKAVDFWVKHVSPDLSDMPQSLFYDLPSARLTVQRHNWDPNSSDMKMYQESIKDLQKHKANFMSSMISNRLMHRADTLKNQEQTLLDSLQQSGTDSAYLRANPKAMQYINVPDHIGTLVPTGVEKRVGDMHYLPTAIAYRGYASEGMNGGKLLRRTANDQADNLAFHSDGTIHSAQPANGEYVTPNATVGSGYAQTFITPQNQAARNNMPLGLNPGWFLALRTKGLNPTIGRATALSEKGKVHEVLPYAGHLTNKSFNDPPFAHAAAELVRDTFGTSLLKKLPPEKIDDLVKQGIQHGIPKLNWHHRGYQQNIPYEVVIKNLEGKKPLSIWRNTSKRIGSEHESKAPGWFGRKPNADTGMYEHFRPDTVARQYEHVPTAELQEALIRFNKIRQQHGSNAVSLPHTLEPPNAFTSIAD